jgi:hypothetical protein
MLHMSCQSCTSAAATSGLWLEFDSPKCIYCTARLIQRLGKLRTPSIDAITARRRAVMRDAVAWGHSETEIRAILALKKLALAPE